MGLDRAHQPSARLLVTAHDDTGKRRIGTSVDLLVRHEGRHEDDVAWASLSDELEVLAPAHLRTTCHDKDHTLQLAMMMRSRFRIGLDRHRSCPQLVGTGAGMRNRRRARHPRRLRCIQIERVTPYNTNAIEALVGH